MTGESSTSNSDVESNSTGGAAHVSVTVNTLLAYAQYCISCATSDNTRHVLCSHFSAEEINEAKDVLWEKLELPEQKRTNSSKRPVSEANVGDIMSALYKLDISADNQLFHVDSMGIGRLPRFNPENLNVVALDHRLAELVDHCRVLQGQVDSYRTLAMRCADRLDVYDTVLQQHSNVLREIKNDLPAYHPTSSKIVRNVDSRVDSRVDRKVNRNVDSNVDRNVESEAKKIKNQAMECPTSNLLTNDQKSTSLPNLSIQDLSQPRNNDQCAGSNSNNYNLRSLFSQKVSNNSSSSCWHQMSIPNSLESSSATESGTSSVTNNNNRTLDKAKHGRKMNKDDDLKEFCAFSGYIQDQDNKTTDHSFQDNSLDVRRKRQRENRRNKLVRGSANILGSRFTGGANEKRLCDIFVHHVAHQSTIGDLKSHLKQQGFDVENMRIDVTSNVAATYKSFRIITSGNLRKSLLDAKVWPVGVWVRDYETFSQGRLHKRSNNQGGQFNNQNGS